jgi:hypothetical protein
LGSDVENPSCGSRNLFKGGVSGSDTDAKFLSAINSASTLGLIENGDDCGEGSIGGGVEKSNSLLEKDGVKGGTLAGCTPPGEAGLETCHKLLEGCRKSSWKLGLHFQLIQTRIWKSLGQWFTTTYGIQLPCNPTTFRVPLLPFVPL